MLFEREYSHGRETGIKGLGIGLARLREAGRRPARTGFA